MAEALHTALEMPLGERRERQSALLARIRAGNANEWQASYLGALAESGRAGGK